MAKNQEENLSFKLDVIIYLLILDLKQKDGLDEKTIKRLVNLLVGSGYKWRDIADILNISSATINKIMQK